MTRSITDRLLVQEHQDEHTHKLQLQSVRRQKSSAERAIEQIRDRRKRQIILGITLNYRKEFRAEATFEDLRRDRATLLEGMERNPKLKFVHDALHKAEEGENSGGLHLHMLIFGDGRHRQGINLCQAVGEFWENTVTNGRGSYYNGNRRAVEAKSEALPYGNVTGQIDPDDTSKWQSVTRYATEYMCKATQPVTTRGKHERTFGIRNFRQANSAKRASKIQS